MKFGGGSTNGATGGGSTGGRHGGGGRDSGGQSKGGIIADSATDERYKEINAKLRRLLSEERKALQHVRMNYAAELRSRTEMEMLLRQCVDDVRQEISLRASSNPTTPGGGQRSSRPGSSGNMLGTLLSTTSSFAQADRERTLELLLSQERVISLIYAKTFPLNQGKVKNNSSSGTALDVSSSSSAQGDGVDAEIIQAISMGLSSNAHAHYNKSREETYDPDSASVSEGGGGPLIAAALAIGDNGDESGGTRLPAI